MTLVTQQIAAYQERASWIRKMFEEGAAMKAQFGAENVFDFSLGNPDLPPPAAVKSALLDMAEGAEQPMAFGYMPNSGYPALRDALAERLSKEQCVELSGDDICVTCGAAGALNTLFRTVLEPGDEVLGMSPFFVEYGFYTENFGGVFKTAPTNPDDFSLDLAAIEAALNEKTRVVLVNSPNNPTGQVYSTEELKGLAALLTKQSEKNGRPIFLVSDEPYRFLVFDDVDVPAILPLYPYSVVVSSFSKSLSLAGERVGYAALSPDMPCSGELMGGFVLANRILGYVNAPAMGQKVLMKALNAQVDVGVYAARRDAMAENLDAGGYEYFMPKGAFYFFPKAPGGDDVAFCRALQEQKVLAVPGRGFGMPGYFRLTFCVGEEIIRNSKEGFVKAIKSM